MSTLLSAIFCYLYNKEFRESGRALATDVNRTCSSLNELHDYKQIVKMAGGKKWENFVLVREPAERFLSGFLFACSSKAIGNATCLGCKDDMKCVLKKVYENSLLFAAGNEDVKSNVLWHIGPQNWHCNLQNNLENFTIVHYSPSRTENLKNDLRRLMLVFCSCEAPFVVTACWPIGCDTTAVMKTYILLTTLFFMILPLLFQATVSNLFPNSTQSLFVQPTNSPSNLTAKRVVSTKITLYNCLNKTLSSSKNIRIIVVVGIAAVEYVLTTSIGWSVDGGAIGMALDLLREQHLIDDYEFIFYVNYTECDPAAAVGVGVEFMKEKKVDVVIIPPCPQQQWKLLVILTKHLAREPTTNVHLNIGFEDFVTETRALKMRRVAEGRGRLLAIDDSQLKAIVEEDPRKTTGEVAEELNVSQSGVRYLHRKKAVAKSALRFFFERAIILHDNARPHVSQMTLQKVDELGYETPPYSTDSPDLSPTDYHFLSISTSYKRSQSKDAKNVHTFSVVALYLLTAFIMAYLSTVYNTAVLGWGYLTNVQFSYVEKFPYITLPIANSLTLGYCLAQLLYNFAWNNLSILYSLDDATFCDTIVTDIETAFADPLTYTPDIVYKTIIDVQDDSLMNDILNNVKSRSRIVLVCINGGADRRKFLVKVAELNMVTDDYLYILTAMRSLGFGTGPEWLNTYLGRYECHKRRERRFGQRSSTKNACGLTGEIVLNQNHSREPFFCVYGLDNSYKQTIFMNITFLTGQPVELVPLYTDEATSIWATRGGKRWLLPLTKPICGYSGLECPKLFWDMYLVYVIVGGVLCIILLISGLCLIVFVIRNRLQEQARLNAEWQIPFVRLVKLPNKREHRSYRSLNSGPSTITNDSTYENENSLYEVYFLDKEPVLIRKHPVVSLTKYDYDSFVKYLHHSFINCHGSLTSACCLVNDGWQMKITDYGLPQLIDQQRQTRSLWVAPEHLTQTPVGCSKAGDVYSFAIICSEVITRKPAWNITARGESILGNVKKELATTRKKAIL
uniref:Guanylate cyclase n=1 Tax=Heterorhabditis bacteriophora TaxID=37862 RepID=A0A1I7XC44_HETBA